MSNYHCPFCSPKYQIHKLNSEGEMICGLCGDKLLKKVLVKPTQILGLIAATAFLSPLALLVMSLFEQKNNSKIIHNSFYLTLSAVRVISIKKQDLIFNRFKLP